MKCLKWCCRIILLFFVIGCNPHKREIKQAMKYWMGREIIFPDSCLAMNIFGKDTLLYAWFGQPYKIVHYVDTSGCNECQLKFYEWQQLRKRVDSLNPNIGIVYMVFAKNYTPVRISQKLNHFSTPVLYDSLGNIGRKNHFSLYPKYKTFLLDTHNQVIGIGNPVENERIWELYKMIIRQNDTTNDIEKNGREGFE